MNAAELARNPQLSEFFVRDLNQQPSGWAAADGSFDAVLCTAGLQYLAKPEAVLAEVRRVLKPGGVVIVAFSNRMFYDKVRPCIRVCWAKKAGGRWESNLGNNVSAVG